MAEETIKPENRLKVDTEMRIQRTFFCSPNDASVHRGMDGRACADDYALDIEWAIPIPQGVIGKYTLRGPSHSKKKAS